MSTATKICRVCGKEYEACHTLKHIAGVFRWQEVACSPECGSIYLARIKASRAATPAENTKAEKDVDVVYNVTSDEYGVADYDDLDIDDGYEFEDFDDESDNIDD